jgi:hypothetical protein
VFAIRTEKYLKTGGQSQVMKIVKFLAAAGLLPALGTSLKFSGHLVAAAWAKPGLPWLQMGCFAGGFLLWVLWHWFLPRPGVLYVFGHECTHALAVWTSGGRVGKMKIGMKEGYVTSDRISAWIALAPYLVPFYPVVVGLLWLAARWVWPSLAFYENGFWAIWGLSWGFHACFTAGLLPTQQSDFSSQGYFFSLVVIVFVNLWISNLLAWMALEPFAWREGGMWLGRMLGRDYASVGRMAVWVFDALRNAFF